jgi:hypothetical protein
MLGKVKLDESQYAYALYRRRAARALPQEQRELALKFARAMEALERTEPDSMERERLAEEARAAAAAFYARVEGAAFKAEGKI